ncbi:MAG: pyruvate, phosphate dikinase [Deltaproteobacteria bacterium]|nr:pyruvate, phosphate dikinase [Deltaproteobacteria bacterium]
MAKEVYFFGAGHADGDGKQKELLGGKGAGLAEMVNLGIPVPAGFTITTELCTEYFRNGGRFPDSLEKEVKRGLSRVEEVMGGQFGSVENPLLLSVRSGARVSMPGMMDTILNLGLNERTVEGLARRTKNRRFAFDSYRRFIEMYSDVVLGLGHEHFEALLDAKKKKKGVRLDTELDLNDLEELTGSFLSLVKKELKQEFPSDPWLQLWGAVGAVFKSWNSRRAIEYRRIHQYPEHWGTAVNVQAMVFGNRGNDCATGVAFTRDPATGEKKFFGEYLVNAQGEDVVAGIRTPHSINGTANSLEKVMPAAYRELFQIQERLERHYREMQDIEFTIQNGKVWMLQTRSGKRTAHAAVRIAVEMVSEGLITEPEAILRVAPAQLDQLLHPTLDPNAPKEVLANGLPASPGAAVGRVVLTADEAQEWVGRGEKVILVRQETSPEDIHGMHVAEGILTARGGMTSHAAVVARGMGKCCVSGCTEIEFLADQVQIGNRQVRKGDWLTLNGSTGEVIWGQVPTTKPDLSGDFGILMKWADKYRRLKIRTNADTPHDSAVARSFGAEGIGLCRTEHMFFDPDRIDIVREMILAQERGEREKALAKLLPIQRADFKGILKAMEGFPVTIRLLDPPLHEFIPKTDRELEDLARRIGVSVSKIKVQAEVLHEANPMLGHRGCRLGVTYPEIYRMQVEAIMEAAADLTCEGVTVYPEIMIPLVGHVEELKRMREEAEQVCQDVLNRRKIKCPYLVGTMIELPRAALTADEIATVADFFSFGTNDLTQTTFGISRDDAAGFLPFYVDHGVFPKNPFVSIDVQGVGELVRIAIEKGRKARPGLKIGICGEHGGDPDSIQFFHEVGLHYVSCSPYRVPIARLAAAHASLKEKAN